MNRVACLALAVVCAGSVVAMTAPRVIAQSPAPAQPDASLDSFQSRGKTLSTLTPTLVLKDDTPAFARPRAQTTHVYGLVWPHRPGFNRMNIEAPISQDIFDELTARGHQIEWVRQYGATGCATAVIIDPATGNRLAGADARRDCYAMGYSG